MYFRDSVIARTAELDIFPVACTMFAWVWASDMMSRRMLKRPLHIAELDDQGNDDNR